MDTVELLELLTEIALERGSLADVRAMAALEVLELLDEVALDLGYGGYEMSSLPVFSADGRLAAGLPATKGGTHSGTFGNGKVTLHRQAVNGAARRRFREPLIGIPNA